MISEALVWTAPPAVIHLY